MTEIESDGLDVVTGGAGFIGSHLVDALLKRGRRVLVVDNFASGNPQNLAHIERTPRFRVERVDVADKQQLMALFAGADRVFHLAAMADIVPSIQNPELYFRSNVDGTYAVLEAARYNGVRRFIYAASSSCYGIPDVYPTPEDTAIDARYPYALTKTMGEQLVMHWAQVYQMPAVSLRFFNVYGPRARTSGTYGAVFGVFLAQILGKKPLTIVGDGNQTRDFTYVSDVVGAVIAAADSTRVGRIYNVGSNATVSVNRLVELLGQSGNVMHIPKRPGEPECTLADTTRIRDELGWSPHVPIETGVKIMLENIDYWREAPVWTVDRIAEATADWFKYLGAPVVGAGD
jgi:UDP-glucose 4-epimerase